jgi:hypothetical protein
MPDNARGPFLKGEKPATQQGAKVQSPSSSSLSDQNKDDVAPLVPNLEPPPLHAPPRSSGLKNDRLVSNRPSISREIFRALIRLSIGVLIGVSAALAWQSYGDEARKLARTWDPSLAWLLPVSTLESPPDGQVSAQGAALPQSAPVTQKPAPAVTSSESGQQLEPITRDLAAVRSSLEQLAVKQEQMAQNIATLQAVVEQDIKQKMSSPLPSQAVPLPPRKHLPAAR